VIAAEISSTRTLASLSATCYGLHLIIFPLLMNRAANFILRTIDRYTVLIWASMHGYSRVVEGLLKAGAAVDALDIDGTSSLIYACQYRHEDVAHCLIAHGAAMDICYRNETPITMAAHRNLPGVLQAMFSHGATIVSKYWWIILPVAWSGHVDVMKLLLENRVDANFRLAKRSSDIPAYANFDIGQTALYIAVCNQHAAMVKLLVESGADVDIVNRGETARQHLVKRWWKLSAAEMQCLKSLSRWSWRRVICFQMCRKIFVSFTTTFIYGILIL
jgi:ankyrin repeat protein